MPDFDANEDATLPGADEGSASEPTEQGFPATPRARELPDGHLDAPEGMSAGRLRPSMLSGRRRADCRACDRGFRLSALRSLPRRRRLWTLCHGRRPGFPS
ncbi:MAG TPA: hypothetical protein VNY35_07610 [Solirubrobacteraceae bacterium]|nr:hypothetical protein [Solirubrobacteraceae bacterium]